MEHLTRWGIHRYNIAVHFEGYGKDHKSIGMRCDYVQTDKDGYITAGLLWLPGQVVWYCNGKEIAEWDDPRVSDIPSDMMFTLPSGGWDNDPLDDAQLPSDFVIDYVRCWERKDLATASAAVPAPMQQSNAAHEMTSATPPPRWLTEARPARPLRLRRRPRHGSRAEVGGDFVFDAEQFVYGGDAEVF